MATTQSRNRQPQRTYNYVQGTAAPKITNPQRRDNQTPKTQVRRSRHIKAERISPIVLASWIIASIVLVLACGVLLTSQTRMNSYVDEISALEARLADIKAENNFNEARINESVDMDQLQQEAEALGMVKLTEDKIIDVEYGGSDYVRQYKSVPEEGEKSDSGILGK